MNRYTLTPILLSLALTAACGMKALDDQQDTMIGGEEGDGGTDGLPPAPIEDHGIAQFCVDRADVYAETHPYFNIEEIREHELWFAPLGRAYDHYLDLDNKPSPWSVPLAGNPGWPLFQYYADDAAERGGSPAALNSGYHLAIPWIGTSDYIDAGHLQFPYTRDLLVGTIGNPPQSGRHTWMSPGCCMLPPTEAELAGDNWEGVLLAVGGHIDTFRSAHADCRAYVRAMGVHPDAGGYPAAYEDLEMLSRDMIAATCISWAEYDPLTAISIAAEEIGEPIPYHPTRMTEQYPANLNYDWVATLGLVSWDDFAAFGDALDKVVQALIGYLYLPPNDFMHARYGSGGGCHFPAALRWSNSAGGTVARYTCPVGYYAQFPDFVEAGDMLTKGIVGSCVLDGVDYAGGSALLGGGLVASPFPLHDAQFFAVQDLPALSEELERSAEEGVTTELAEILTLADGTPTVLEGDKLAWWNSPWEGDPQPIGEALTRTVGYDTADLEGATGWSHDEAARFIDQQQIVPLGDVIDGLPENLAARPANTMRSHNTWRLRIERGDEVRFLYFVDRLLE